MAPEPPCRSNHDCAPDFDMNTVDIVTDSNKVKLLKFCVSTNGKVGVFDEFF